MASRLFLSFIAHLLRLLMFPEGAESGTFLSTQAALLKQELHESEEAQALQQSRSLARLNTASKELAAALRNKLLQGKYKINVKIPVLAEAARTSLREEAERIGNEDAQGADLVRLFAASTPSDVLILAAPADAGPFSDASLRSQTDNSENAVSEETIVTDGRGHSATRKTSCKNGACVQQTVVGPAEMYGDAMSGNDAQDMSFSNDIEEDPFSTAVHGMMHAMRAVERALGRKGLHKILRHGSTGSQSWDLIDSRTNATDGSNATQEASDNPAPPGVIESEETSIVNGHVVTRRKHCEGGHCAVKVVEGQLKPRDDDRDPQPDMPGHGHVVVIPLPPGSRVDGLPGGRFPEASPAEESQVLLSAEPQLLWQS